MGSKAHPKSLRDYFTLQRGTTYQSSRLGEPGPVLLGLATIRRNGGFRSDSLRTYGGDSPIHLLVHPGDLYASLKDVTQSADLLGAVARLPAGHPPGRLTQDTVRLEPKFEGVPIEYIYWLLRTPQCRTHCRAFATGTTNLGLARDDFLAFSVPELNETRREIVYALTVLEDRITLNQRMNETLEAMARALFKSWFVDFDPVHAKATLKNHRTNQCLLVGQSHKPSHQVTADAAGGSDWSVERASAFLDRMNPDIAALFPDSFVDSKRGPIPEGWDGKALDEIAVFNNGLALQKYRPQGKEKGLPVVKIAQLRSGKADSGERAAATIRPECVIEDGDVIFGAYIQ